MPNHMGNRPGGKKARKITWFSNSPKKDENFGRCVMSCRIDLPSTWTWSQTMASQFIKILGHAQVLPLTFNFAPIFVGPSEQLEAGSHWAVFCKNRSVDIFTSTVQVVMMELIMFSSCHSLSFLGKLELNNLNRSASSKQLPKSIPAWVEFNFGAEKSKEQIA